MINKLKRILQLTAWFTLCSVFVLGILRPFGVQIVNYSSLFALFLDFADMAWITFVSSAICVFLNLFKDNGTIKGYIRDMSIVWIFGIVIFTLIQWLAYERIYYLKVLPTIIYICIVILGFQTLCYWIRNLYRKRNELQAINEMLRQQQELHAMQNEEDSIIDENKQCVLHSDYGGQDIAIHPHNFIYVESVGNYADVCYIDNEQLTNTSIRTTIKQLKEDLSEYEFIVQCHRGFLVNLDYVESMEGSNGRFFLNMFYSGKKIPVSRTNKTSIVDVLSTLQK
ncbi:MAG: LytTR family transcriptional regulator [Bacteroidales bacterium]|nr:LytTR family transcriptional regulator [Candidatus Liminaster caballi]